MSRLIPPEIKNDEFYEAIKKIASQGNIQTILEIGSSSGEGSTEAFVAGLRENPNKPRLFCMEVSKKRFKVLQERYADEKSVKCYNLSSISMDMFPSEDEVIAFYHKKKTNLNQTPIEVVLNWLKQDIEYVKDTRVEDKGIEKIKKENQIDFFDVVLIDGSEFTGLKELNIVYGAKFICLDDILTFKNYESYQKLIADPKYALYSRNVKLRNGYAIFKKIDFSFETEKKEQLLVRKLVRPGMTAFDVGANIGDYSTLFSELVGSEGRVYSFEPTSSTFKKLQERIEKYLCKNIYAFQNAVFSANKQIEFNEFSEEYSVWNSIGKPQMLNPTTRNEYVPIVKTEIVEAITLDSFCQKHQIESIDYLKLDVEGAESDALFGAVGLLAKKAIKYLQFEISQKMLEGLGRSDREIFDLLRQYGYECHKIQQDGEIGEEVKGSKAFYENYIAFPSSLSINFVTIVLNGQPFIRYHVEVFKKLPFPWHWHIIEGVADLSHDTAWCLKQGGRISDEIHRNGRSNDGTSEYIDELKRLAPENITLYRKPEGTFWDGKREMVNAPLANIREECLLWQVDVDELWTVEQICKARQIFLDSPEKTAAFYWCWYFVGENLLISTRNGYAQNPNQEWLRTWRFKPGSVWASHEPPRLIEPLANGQWREVARVNPFLHEETEKHGLVFQHFAYVTQEQSKFKEQYYGYKGAVSQWKALQSETNLPTLLRNYFSWVSDNTMVNTAESLGVVPIAQKEASSAIWQFLEPNKQLKPGAKRKKIIIDGVFFQINNTGIARVWISLLQEWVRTGFAKQVLMLDRSGTAPRIAGVKYLGVRSYDYNNTDGDRAYLQQICDEEKADLFISTYYTTPVSTPSVFMAYDMIPELLRIDLGEPMWREKHYGIRHASGYIAISESTARDLLRCFPEIAPESVTVARCGIQSYFQPAAAAEIQQFKSKYEIAKPYFILVGTRSGRYKNATLFFQALAGLENSDNFEIVCVGGSPRLEPALTGYVPESAVRILQLSDVELRAAYSGAVSLVYPSKYEGFGLPVVEAMACGCPVITCPNGSIPEVAGEAALYINDSDVAGMAKALVEVQKPETRDRLIAAGLQQAKKFSWSQMSEIVSAKLQNLQPKPQTDGGRWRPYTLHPTPHTLSLGNIPNLARQFRENNGNREILAQLRQGRRLLAEFWLRVLSEELPDTYAGEAGEAHRALLDSGIKDELLTESDREFLAQLASGLSRGWAEPKAIQTFLAATLYARCYELPLQYQGAPIPRWLFADYVKFLLAPPSYFRELGQVEKYYNYYRELVSYISSRIASNPESAIWQHVAWLFSQNASLLPLYFAPGSLREVYTQRSQIMEFALKSRGHQLDFSFSTRTPVAGKKQKIRLGVLKGHWNPQTETFATIPVFEHLDREQFEIILYAVNVTGSPLEQYCQQKGDRLVKLPSNLSKQVQTIRFDDLDILWIGTNVTAVTNQITFLALHRLARVQVTSLASPVSTGMTNIDCYIAGSLTAPASASEQYREQLKTIEGSGLCFSYPLKAEVPTILPDRSSWGASEDTTVFISGANFFKIIPELRETWAKILVAVPNSILVLYPFGPTWTPSYPAIPFVELLRQEFAKHGIDINRLLIIKTLPTSADIKECLKLADVYLDSYPYGGATSLLDPLEVGLPTVAFEGDMLRFRQAIALLRELGITDLIADSEEAYLNLAIELGTNRDRRNALRKQILQKMQQLPPFLDSPAYGAKIGNLFKELVGESQQEGRGYAQHQEGQASRLSQAIASDPEPPVGQANAASQPIAEEFLPNKITNLHQTRQQLAQHWMTTSDAQLENSYSGHRVKIHYKILNSRIKYESISEAEQDFVKNLVAKISEGLNQPQSLQSLLAVMLYLHAYQLRSPLTPLKNAIGSGSRWYENAPIPQWLLRDFIIFLIHTPELFSNIGEATRYVEYMQELVDYLHQRIFSQTDSQTWKEIARLFSQNTNLVHLYFNTANLKNVLTKISEITEFSLEEDYRIDYSFPERPNRPKVRIGILKDNFNASTETFATLPVFEHLNRDQFEIILYATEFKNRPLEKYCQSRADQLIKLPENVPDQVKTIRADDLDILFIGMNATVRLRERGLLELHRLARIQINSFCSPITTRMRHIDYYIAGELTAPAPNYQDQYRERLVNLPGSGICFRFPIEPPPATVKTDRQSWGATSESIIFISGANFNKIIPELRETWVKIIAAVPNSILVLYPFGPAWGSYYPAIPFMNQMRGVFSKYGVDPNRLVIINTLPSPADIKECLKIADVYLDSYPYAGATSLIDPLKVGLPPVLWEGNTLRSRQGSALLRELQIPELIANSEETYMNLAITLATNSQLRQQLRQKIQQQMQNNPPFLDSRAYSAKIGNLFQQLFQEWQGTQKSNPLNVVGAVPPCPPNLTNPLNPVRAVPPCPPSEVTTKEFLNRAIGCVNLYYIDPSEQAIAEELRKIRRQLADFWLNTAPEQLQQFYQSDLGQAYEKLVTSEIKKEPLSPTEETFVQHLASELSLGVRSPKAINYLLAARLYRPVQIPANTRGIPDWLVLE